MKVNLEADINNILFLEYMQQQQERNQLKINADKKEIWYCREAPQEGFNNNEKKIP